LSEVILEERMMKLTDIGKSERETQDRVFALFRDDLANAWQVKPSATHG